MKDISAVSEFFSTYWQFKVVAAKQMTAKILSATLQSFGYTMQEFWHDSPCCDQPCQSADEDCVMQLVYLIGKQARFQVHNFLLIRRYFTDCCHYFALQMWPCPPSFSGPARWGRRCAVTLTLAACHGAVSLRCWRTLLKMSWSGKSWGSSAHLRDRWDGFCFARELGWNLTWRITHAVRWLSCLWSFHLCFSRLHQKLTVS